LGDADDTIADEDVKTNNDDDITPRDVNTNNDDETMMMALFLKMQIMMMTLLVEM
jgi:hypothetical protein